MGHLHSWSARIHYDAVRGALGGTCDSLHGFGVEQDLDDEVGERMNRAMHIGVVLPQVGADWQRVLDSARHAEEVGADSVWFVDHLLGFPPDKGILEAWTLATAVAASTERVEIGVQVLCQSFRPPGLLARMIATLDQISGGRVRVLVGAGWFEQEYHAYGYRFGSPGERLGELQDYARILRGVLNAREPFTYEGRHHSVRGALNVPPPVRSPLPVEVGGAGNRLMEFVAKEADGWNCPAAALGMLDDRLALLETRCAAAGRSVDDIRVSLQIVCAVGDEEAAKHPGLAMFSPDLGLVGSVDEATERVRAIGSKGITDFNCVLPPGSRGRACLEKLVGEVRPRLGEAH